LNFKSKYAIKHEITTIGINLKYRVIAFTFRLSRFLFCKNEWAKTKDKIAKKMYNGNELFVKTE
jgi:hypothetical protein